MYFYKNVDIKDLESIMDNGILSLNESGNDNWEDGRRADNSKEVVYMFRPLGEQNSFCNYGAALLEIELDEKCVEKHQISFNDRNYGMYDEYISGKIEPDCINKIYIPDIFRSNVELELSEKITSQITWCEIQATYYKKDVYGKVCEREKCPIGVLEQFAKTAEVMDSTMFNFFRGHNNDRTMIDLYDVRYLIK